MATAALRCAPSVQSLASKGTPAAALLDGIKAEYLLADQGYDTNRARAAARAGGMTPVIPPQRRRQVVREYDRDWYQLRHLVENGFARFKEWRGAA